jgi:hypothetical protein
MNSDLNTWLISEASKPNESKMLQLVGGDEARRGELAGRLLSGIEKPDLLMYHVDVLHSYDGHRAYEFLIEYCTSDPSVGIYYGCRGFTKKQYSHPKEILQFRQEFANLKNELIQKLNRKFLGKDFTHRLLPTDNTDSKTYWLFWIQLQPDEDINGVGLTATTLIRDIFAKHLGITPNSSQDPEKQSPAISFYDQLLRKCVSPSAYDHSQMFATIIRYLEADGIIVREVGETNVWRFMGAPKHATNADFSCLMHIIFTKYIHPKELRVDNNMKLVPWTQIRTVFIGKEGSAFKDEIRTQYQRVNESKEIFWNEMISKYLKTSLQD